MPASCSDHSLGGLLLAGGGGGSGGAIEGGDVRLTPPTPIPLCLEVYKISKTRQDKTYRSNTALTDDCMILQWSMRHNRHTGSYRQTDRQTDGETDRQMGRQTDKQQTHTHLPKPPLSPYRLACHPLCPGVVIHAQTEPTHTHTEYV